MNLEATAMSGPSAKIICDSINEWGQRLVTMEVKMHRFILAEMNTHRVFSRNSASSRAIPVGKTMAKVMTNPALPVHWGAEKKGMQSGDALDPEAREECVRVWMGSRQEMLVSADELLELGLHKSLINRLLEPFMWHTAIITATEWDNFFHQRCHPDAQPEMKAVADKMQIAYFTSTPRQLAHGQWHMPYISIDDWAEIGEEGPEIHYMEGVEKLKKISVARCARVSYLTHEGVRDLSEDLKLFERLQGSGHWSPFEHVATPVAGEMQGNVRVYRDCGNFHGWKQFRKEFRDENRTNFIPNLPELAHIRMKMEAGVQR